MSRFLSNPLLEVLAPEEVTAAGGERQLYRLTADFVYSSDAVGVLTAPAGMLTDFASIPRAIWNLLDPEDPCILRGSIIHDACYKYGGSFPGREAINRAQADGALREAMGISGATKFQMFAVYHALRLFGAPNWRGSSS